MEKLVADILMFCSNLLFVGSLTRITRDHFRGIVIQDPEPMLGTLIAIYLLLAAQWTLGLYISAISAAINCLFYIAILFSNYNTNTFIKYIVILMTGILVGYMTLI